MNEQTEKLRGKIDEIFDDSYSLEASVCPEHPIFQRQKALNEVLQALKEAGLKFVPDNWDLEYGVHWAHTIKAINSQIKEIEL